MAENLLFAPVRVGRLHLSNRIVMAPMTRNRTPGHVPNALNVEYYVQRASAGLILTEGVAPSAAGQGYLDIPGLYTAEQERGWRDVAEAVHRSGGRIFAQLMHVGRVSHPSFLGGARPVGPSAVRASGTVMTANGRANYVTPRELCHDEIRATIADFAAAASRAISAGLDGVEIHAANGYLPHQFLSAATNLRSDGWGGSIEGRMRFILEIVEAVSTAIGSDRLGVRLSPGNSFNDMYEPDASALYPQLLRTLDRRGIAYLHIVDSAPGFDVPRLARSNFAGTLILNGEMSPAAAASCIEMGVADLVSFGRLFISNPDLPIRIREDAPYADPDPLTYYGGGRRGYTDYPALSAGGL